MKVFFRIVLIGLAGLFLFATPIPNNSLAHTNGQTEMPRSLAKGRSPSPATTFFDGRIVIKLKAPVYFLGKLTSSLSINKRFSRHNVHTVRQAYPFLEYSTLRQAGSLSRVHYLSYGSGEDPLTVAADLARDPNVEYAEPIPVVSLSDTPNDSLFGQQRHFLTIQAEAAWDLVKGEDGPVVIAIVDGGTDWRHEDLRDNIWVNEDEIANNGIDDDNNGFVDDVRGWNFATGSGDPTGRPQQPMNHQHGTHTAGIAGAVTNNTLGVTGVSWNCVIMPINISARSAGNDTTLGSQAYDGITYAASNGADIISCSWGGPFRSDFQQEVINFAHANGALVVAAAGNGGVNNDEVPHFPSNYNHVLAVGSVNLSDTKSSFSSFGLSVDLYAPGEFIFSTFPDDSYGRISGTSFSTPAVAGVAGLVKTLHPDWTADQVLEQVRVTSDDITGRNPSLAGLLGKGRVNAFRAVTVTDLPSVRVVGVSYTDAGGDGRIDPGEQAVLTLQITNFLASTSNLSFTLSTDDPRVSISNPNASLPSLNTNDTLGVDFPFSLPITIPDGQIVTLLVDIAADGYEDRDIIGLPINPAQFIDHNTGTLTASITTQGNIGFIDFDTNSGGKGFIFNGSNLLFEGGLILGTGVSTVSDCIRGGDGSSQDDDFKPVSVLSITSPGEVSDEYGTIVLEDEFADNPLGVRIIQESFTYNEEPFNDFVIFKYTIKNISKSDLSSLYVGQFFDWDINSQIVGSPDFARFDEAGGYGFVQDRRNNPTKLAATKILTSPGLTSYRSIHNPNEIYGGDAGNGFTFAEKWNFLRGGIQTRNIDDIDVSTLTASGPFTLEPEQSVEVAFAVIGAESTSDLAANVSAAQFLWDNDLVPEVDQRPPGISTSVLQNPAASKYADIVVVSDRTLLSAPTVTVSVEDQTTAVEMTAIPGAGATYKGAFEFTRSGSHTIQTTAVGALNGVDSTATRSFGVALAKPGVLTSLSALNKKALLQISENAVRDVTYFVADYHEADGVLIYEFGPRQEFPELLSIEIEYQPERFRDPGKIFIYHKQGEEWAPLQTQVFTESHRAKVRVSRLGEFKIGYDADFDGTNLVPTEFSLRQNYPNPFNPTTIIEYSLPRDENVELIVFNSLGQTVRTLYSGEQLAGNHQVPWDGRDEQGQRVASGVFFYRIEMGDFIRTHKMILLR